MSRFSKYVLRLDDVAEKSKKLATDLDANVTKAKQKCDFYRADRIGEPTRGALDPDEYVAALEWRAKLAAAEQASEKFWQNLPEQTAQKIAEIRAEFRAALDDAFSADPNQLDTATLTLLESGICDAHEYARLLDKAVAKGNTTLARVIGSYADKTADKVEHDTVDGNSAKANEYRAIAVQAAEAGKIADSYMDAFDSYAYAIQTATMNREMLTGDDLFNFSANTLQTFNSLGG